MLVTPSATITTISKCKPGQIIRDASGRDTDFRITVSPQNGSFYAIRLTDGWPKLESYEDFDASVLAYADGTFQISVDHLELVTTDSNELNRQQGQIVYTNSGPLLVAASPGGAALRCVNLETGEIQQGGGIIRGVAFGSWSIQQKLESTTIEVFSFKLKP